MGIKNIPKKIAYGTVKEIAAFMAPLTALSSTAGKGDGYLDNIVAAYHVPEQIYQVGKAFITNQGVRDFTFQRLGDLAAIVGSSAKNIVEKPYETALAAGIVYGLTRFSPHIIKGGTSLFKGKKK